ncbi:MAG: nicotianamine synthase family protein [Methanosarcinaceae archaeon]
MSNIAEKTIKTIMAELLKIESTIKYLKDQDILQGTSNHLVTNFQRLDYLAALDIDDQLAEETICDPEYHTVIEDIVRFRNLYSLRLEIENAKAILASEDPWGVLKNFTHFPNYIQLSRTEYQGSELKLGDTVVFLGSGPLPLTLIALCHFHGLKGIGIERDPDRAELSRKVLEKLGLLDQIMIIHGNHFILPLNMKYDHLMVAAAAEPKKEIFEYLANVLPKGIGISYRIYEKGLRRVLETCSSFELPEQFVENLRIRPEPPVNNTVVFLKKEFC